MDKAIASVILLSVGGYVLWSMYVTAAMEMGWMRFGTVDSLAFSVGGFAWVAIGIAAILWAGDTIWGGGK